MSRPQDRPVFPSNAEVQEALLILLFEYGGETQALLAASTYRPLADLFGLNDETRTIQRDVCNGDGRSEAYWHTRVQTAHGKLVRSGDLYPTYTHWRGGGIWRLTEQGKCRATQLAAERPRVAVANQTPMNPVPAWLLTQSPAEYFTLERLGLVEAQK